MCDAPVKQGADPVGGSPKEFGAFIKNETVKYARLIREADVKAD